MLDKCNETYKIAGEYTMDKMKDIELLTELGFTMHTLDDVYIIDGKINPILYITEDIVAEVNKNLVLTHNKENGLLSIIFQDTKLCIQTDYKDYDSRIISSDYTADWFFVTMTTHNYLMCSILIDKYGEVTFGSH